MSHTTTDMTDTTADLTYTAKELPVFNGNPFIEKLPDLLSKADYFKLIKRQPTYDEALRSAQNHIRAQAIADVFDVLVPLPRHFTEQTVIARMIRRGYLARNPIPKSFWKSIDQKVAELRKDFPKLALVAASRPDHLGCASDLNTSKIGMTGCGKTLSTKACLNTYDQVIPQVEYFGHKLNIQQVVWLYLQAPHKGSTRDLCREFFAALDRALGTTYELQFGRRTEHEMLGHMIRLSYVHAVGLLVIDEVQEFSNIKSGGKDALVGFLLRLTNAISVPVLMIGTYKAASVLHNHMRQIRRSTGIGMPSDWGPLTKAEWATFIAELWKFQYTKTSTELTPPLSDALFFECGGIPDFATKIYFLAQDRLIATNDGKRSEKITIPVMKSVARAYLKPAREALEAIRTKNEKKLRALEDVILPTIEEYVAEQRAAIEVTFAPEPDVPSQAPEHRTSTTEGISAASSATRLPQCPRRRLRYRSRLPRWTQSSRKSLVMT